MERGNVKLHVHFETGDFKVNEVVQGVDSDAAVASMQALVAQKAGFLVGAFIRKMTPLQFAQEATRRYNTASKSDAPVPQSCEEFVTMGVARGFATVVDE